MSTPTLPTRLGGEVAGYAVLRLEPTGIAYLKDAVTRPEFRRHGVYLALVAHRLTVARAAGGIAAVIQAQADTAAPILLKRGFRRVCRLVAFQCQAASRPDGGGADLSSVC